MPELAQTEGNQLVAISRDESLSPSLFTFRSRVTTIHRAWYYVFMTARGRLLQQRRDNQQNRGRAEHPQVGQTIAVEEARHHATGAESSEEADAELPRM